LVGHRPVIDLPQSGGIRALFGPRQMFGLTTNAGIPTLQRTRTNRNPLEIESMKNIQLFLIGLCVIVAAKLAPAAELEPGLQGEYFDLGSNVEDFPKLE